MNVLSRGDKRDFHITMVEMYELFLSELQDKSAPLKIIKVMDRPLNEWMTNRILALKAIIEKMSYFGRKLVLQ